MSLNFYDTQYPTIENIQLLSNYTNKFEIMLTNSNNDYVDITNLNVGGIMYEGNSDGQTTLTPVIDFIVNKYAINGSTYQNFMIITFIPELDFIGSNDTSRSYTIGFTNFNNTFNLGESYSGSLIYVYNNGMSDLIPLGTAVFCLCENTEVLTPFGYKLIQDLNNDDLVTTSDSRHVQIKKIYKTRVNAKNNDNYWPVIIPANSIGENYPEKDCKMSQYHAIKLNDNWIMPNKNMEIFKKDTSEEVINYYHIRLQNYKTDNLVINGGLVVESLGDGSKEDGLEWELRNNQSIIL